LRFRISGFHGTGEHFANLDPLIPVEIEHVGSREIEFVQLPDINAARIALRERERISVDRLAQAAEAA
jgi:hypothetical protein